MDGIVRSNFTEWPQFIYNEHMRTYSTLQSSTSYVLAYVTLTLVENDRLVNPMVHKAC